MATTEVIRSARFPDLDDEELFPRLSDAKLDVVGQARAAADGRARRGAVRARRPRRAVLRDRARARRAGRSQARQGRPHRAGGQPHVHRRHRRIHGRADDQRLRGRRADGRDRVRPVRAAGDGRALAGVRRAHLRDAAGAARLARGRGARRDAHHRRRADPAGRSRSAICSSATCCRCGSTTSTPTRRAPRCSGGSTSRAPRRPCSCTRPT